MEYDFMHIYIVGSLIYRKYLFGKSIFNTYFKAIQKHVYRFKRIINTSNYSPTLVCLNAKVTKI